MSDQRKWVLTTIALSAWVLCLVLLIQGAVPFTFIVLVCAAFSVLIGAIHAR